MGILEKLQSFCCGHGQTPIFQEYDLTVYDRGDVSDSELASREVLQAVKPCSQFPVGLPTECQPQPINAIDLEEINSPGWAMCH